MEVDEADTGDAESLIDFSRGEVTDMANVVCADYGCGWTNKGEWVERTIIERTSVSCNLCRRDEGFWRMLICNELPFYAAQMACLLHEGVEANKKEEMQECRRWKPWV